MMFDKVGRQLRYFILICILMLSSWAKAQTASGNSSQDIVSASFESVMDYVAVNQVEAPAAARIYAITAIALHDSLSRPDAGLRYVIDDKNKRQSVNSQMFTRDVMAALLSNGFLTITDRDASASSFANNITARLPLPEPMTQIMPSTGEPYVHPEWRQAKPLELVSADMFRPSGPPAASTPAYDDALNEVKQFGEDVSYYRTADESLTAVFWGDAAGTYTGPGHWNAIALDITKAMPIERRLDIILALNVALYDVSIAAWDSKYHFMYPRPTEVINRMEDRKTPWAAMGDIPNHPEYVSGHSAFSGAAATVLSLMIGEKSFCSKAQYFWNVELCYDTFLGAARTAGQSRIYGGIHFQFSNQDGLTLGYKVAHYSLDTLRAKGVIK